MILFIQACETVSIKKTTGKGDGVIEVDTRLLDAYKKALSLMQKNNNKAAFKIFKDIILKDDRLSGPHANIGLIYLKTGQNESAKKAFKAALKRNPENMTALNQLAILKRKSGDFSKARKDYERILKIKNNHTYAHLNLGIVCDIYLQDYQCALKHYKTYLKLVGDDEKVNNWIIDLKGRM